MSMKLKSNLSCSLGSDSDTFTTSSCHPAPHPGGSQLRIRCMSWIVSALSTLLVLTSRRIPLATVSGWRPALIAAAASDIAFWPSALFPPRPASIAFCMSSAHAMKWCSRCTPTTRRCEGCDDGASDVIDEPVPPPQLTILWLCLRIVFSWDEEDVRARRLS